ncbi:hypothetical protein PSHT_11333, partial [Puccinia striiformis]
SRINMMYYSSSWKVLLTLSAIIVLAAQLVSIAAQDPELDFYNFQTGQEDHHTLQARQAVAQEEGAGETDAQKPEDQAAKQLIEMILDTIGADAVIKMLPEVNTARENLLKIVNKQSQDQDNAKRITAANDNSTKILKDIIAKPEDTNFIKENYPALKAGFDELFNAYGSTLNLALPVAAKELEAKKPKESSDKSDKTPPK